MRDILLLSLVMILAYSGFALLSLSQTRHWRRMAITKPVSRTAVWPLRVGSFTLLAAGLVTALIRDGASFGVLLWATSISLAALAVALTLSWRPAWLGAFGKPFLAIGRTRSRRSRF